MWRLMPAGSAGILRKGHIPPPGHGIFDAPVSPAAPPSPGRSLLLRLTGEPLPTASWDFVQSRAECLAFPVAPESLT